MGRVETPYRALSGKQASAPTGQVLRFVRDGWFNSPVSLNALVFADGEGKLAGDSVAREPSPRSIVLSRMRISFSLMLRYRTGA